MSKILFFIAAVLCGSYSIAQDNVIEDIPDTENKLTHYIGLQANPLLRQILSLSNVSDSDNPFLLTYAMRFNPSDLTVNAGFGHSQSTSEDQDGLKISSTDFSGRLGIGKRHTLGKRFEVGYGLDFITGKTSTETFTIQVINFGNGKDSTFTTTKSVLRNYGLGPQINISFLITENILFGTEASYYYIRSTEKFHVESVNHSTINDITLINTDLINDEIKISEFSLQIPIALFLIIKF